MTTIRGTATTNVSGDVEGIRDEQQQHDALKHDLWERGLDIHGKSYFR
jgi:hypothetical protein